MGNILIVYNMTIHDLYNNGKHVYTFTTYESMDNYWSMDYFFKQNPELLDYISLYDGTQVFLTHPDYDYELQLDAGGLGDFYSHKIDVTLNK